MQLAYGGLLVHRLHQLKELSNFRRIKMALQFNSIDADTGLHLTDAYARVVSFNGDKDVVRFTLGVYVNQTARESDKQVVDMVNFEIPYVDGMSMSSLYTYLKTLPEFAGAIDV